ncbi:MAG: SIR2 family protein, partial [Polyangiaceae bacterium]|nr:SIR2 family protein [Polyangiaceae bacterium]
MVGAGLSLNADPLPGVTARFLTWRELVRKMFDELHPPVSGEDTEKRVEQFNSTNPLRIASQYEAAFGRRKLDIFIRDKNPDSSFKPGKLHTSLLQLPWVDVFTTNYDTLLERTEIPGRAYQPVTKASELTTAFSPRIIKLHGSFPSQTPFIISEEDYRTYPKAFAPFVNTVRQSLLENTLVLVGFSGDDPNFLEWTGWIRDELGEAHAPIYLIGPLGLKHSERSLIERRGVTPIDLTPVFAREIQPPSQGIHAASLEWFIASLAASRHPLPDEWPRFPAISPETPSGCPPVLPNKTVVPTEAEYPPNKLDLDAVNRVYSRWRFERMRYPGWLILNESKRSEIWHSTMIWIDKLLAFANAEQWSVADRLVLFREINWRLEVCLIPLFQREIRHFQNAVDEAFEELSQGKTLECSILPVVRTASANEIIDAWLSLAFGLLREARETYANERWERMKEQIDKVVSLHSAYQDRVAYEDVLWEMWNVEHDAAKEKLARWQPSLLSPLAGMWKAGLLAELDELGEACTILRSTLSAIRETLRTEGNNVAILSLEGWCTYLLWIVAIAQNIGSYSLIHQEFGERWHELESFDCSPWPHKKDFSKALAKSTPQPCKTAVETRGFDPGDVRASNSYPSDLLEKHFPAFASIRHYELVGIPMRISHFNPVGQELSNACQWIAPFIEFWSPALLIRAGRVEELKTGGFLSRTSVAEMEAELAKRLYEWCFRIFERQQEKATRSIAIDSAHEAVLETVVEVLSRLSVRGDDDYLGKTFPVALQFHTEPIVRTHRRMHNTADLWLHRLFLAASDRLLLEWLPQLIKEHLLDDWTVTMAPYGMSWPEPIRHFPKDRMWERTSEYPELVEKIRGSTNWLLRRAASESGEGRQRSLFRLTCVLEAELMTPAQKAKLGELLWADQASNGLPCRGTYAVFGLLHLPAPENVDVQGAVKEHIMSLSSQGMVVRGPDGQTSIDDPPGWLVQPMICEATFASKPIVQLRDELIGKVEWLPDDAQQLYEKAYAWWSTDREMFNLVKSDALCRNNWIDPILNTFDILGSFLSRAILPYVNWGDDDAKWNALLKWMEEV